MAASNTAPICCASSAAACLIEITCRISLMEQARCVEVPRLTRLVLPKLQAGSRLRVEALGEAAVDLAGVAFEDLVLVLVGEPRHLIDVALGVIVMVAGA